MKNILFFIVLCILTLSNAFSNRVIISSWLQTPAHPLSLPAFHANRNVAGNTFEVADLLRFNHIHLQNQFPQEGHILANSDGKDLMWRSVFSDADGNILTEASENASHQATYLAVYIWVDRYMHTSLELRSPYFLRAWLNGEQIGTKTTTEEDENRMGRVSKELKLERGKHLLIIKAVKPAGTTPGWKIQANLDVKEPFSVNDLSFSHSPTNRKNISHVLDGLRATRIQLSADGKYYAISYQQSLPPSDQSESWTEIRKVADQKLVQSFRHARISQLQWLPSGNRFSYISTRDRKSTLFVQDIEKQILTPVMEEMENLASYKWAPNERFIIYSLREEATGNTGDMRHILGMEDRQSQFRTRNFLYKYDIPAKTHQRLTSGNLTASLHDISPDSQTILISQQRPDYAARKFSKQTVYLLNLNSLKPDTLWADMEVSVRAVFSPDGKFLLVTGGPSAFGSMGENVPLGMIPNNYDTQAYLYNFSTRNITPFTRNFNPSVSSVHWNSTDNNIYMLTVDEDFQRVYRYDIRRDQISPVNLGHEFVSSIDFAEKAPVAVFRGSLTNRHASFYSVNLRNMRQTLLDNSEAEIYKHVEFGEVQNWNFTASSGVEVKGRVYLPTGFDPSRKYPVIVYYYGGTTPVGRTFAGRYPFNLWAGHGYLVYVLQPSGAIGFGQEFSSAHVNNWGITVADEIIEGTKQFLAAHPFADPTKVGCAGASYGGFMTMLLMTRTDIYAAAISHAGISSISSYWGEGYWGYSYSSEASAGSFPWNNTELYINQSPLFHADKVTTPLLLITGDSDTNVPVGESIQMYTALKILDRPVELIMVKGEDHHITTYGKRIKWHNTIMAWWDKHLKEQNQWWEEQYPVKYF
jgi:dipeptidyl aminopeptidase/acylaminoacyl peptidase